MKGYFGKSTEAFASLGAYPGIEEPALAGGFDEADLKAAFPFMPDARTASPRAVPAPGASLDEWGARAQSAIGVAVEGIRSHAPEIKLQAERMADAARSSAEGIIGELRGRAPELRARAEDFGREAIAGTRRASPPIVLISLIAVVAAVVVLAVASIGPRLIAAVSVSDFGMGRWVDALLPDTGEGAPGRSAALPLPPPDSNTAATAPADATRPAVPAPRQFTISGPAEAVTPSKVIVENRLVILSGVVPVEHPGALQGFRAYIAQAGHIECVLATAGALEGVCKTSRGVNIAEAVVLSGMATAAPNAPDFLHNAEREARANRAGIWGTR